MSPSQRTGLRQVLSGRPDIVGLIFNRNLPIVRSALAAYHPLGEAAAAAAEQDLEVWFRRLARRSAANRSAKSLRRSLLFAACHYGRSLQVGRLGGLSRDESMNGVLMIAPQEPASDLAQCFEEESLRE